MIDKILKFMNDEMSLANDFLYGYLLVIVLVLTGIYFSYITRFVQFRMFFEACKVLVEKKDKYNKHHLTPFQALMISTASRVGIGNIAGISAAIVAGGPGALFWMCLMAFLGAASAFAESTLAQIYKTKDVFGFKGGPAYYIKNGLGIKWMASLFAVILIITYAYGFNGLQSYTMTSAFQIYYDQSAGATSFSDSGLPVGIGIILTAFVAVMFFSKSHVIGKVSSYIVPFMALAYILLAFIAICLNLDKLPSVFDMIIKSAFDFKAIFGGFAGSVIVYGIKRGLFSNEAGMGSAPNAAAAAHTSHPVKQGLVQAMAVFIDMTICVASGMIVLFSQAYITKQTGASGELLTALPLVQAAMREHYGEIGLHFTTLAVVLFAITSLIGNYYYAQANIKYLTKNHKVAIAFKLTAVAMIFVGAQMNLTIAWNIADITMAAMATINIAAIFMLSKVMIKALKDYESQRKAGLNPEFDPENIGIANTTCWRKK